MSYDRMMDECRALGNALPRRVWVQLGSGQWYTREPTEKDIKARKDHMRAIIQRGHLSLPARPARGV